MNYPKRWSRGWGLLITASRHKLDLVFFHRELMNVQKNLDPTVLFPCAESEGETEKDEEGGRVGSPTTASSVSSGNAV